MPKNPHADFTPALEGYSGQGKFRFWCQMTLPLTYDDSLSYYELLCKVVNYLNHTIEDVANAETNVSRLAEAYTQLQNYVNNYFDDLDIEAELRNVLDAMAEDGTLDDLLDPLVQDHLPSVVDDQIDDVVADQINDAVAGQIDAVVAEQLPPLVEEGIPDEVSDWLTENVDPVGSAVVVDSSLTISGAAADAKVTGDELADLKTQITKLNNVVYGESLIPIETINSAFIRTDGSIVSGYSIYSIKYYEVSENSNIDVIGAIKGNSIAVVSIWNSDRTAMKEIIYTSSQNIEVVDYSVNLDLESNEVLAVVQYNDVEVIVKKTGGIEEELDSLIEENLPERVGDIELLVTGVSIEAIETVSDSFIGTNGNINSGYTDYSIKYYQTNERNSIKVKGAIKGRYVAVVSIWNSDRTTMKEIIYTSSQNDEVIPYSVDFILESNEYLAVVEYVNNPISVEIEGELDKEISILNEEVDALNDFNQPTIIPPNGSQSAETQTTPDFSILTGKTWNAVGDSITYGDYYRSGVATRLGITVNNKGVSSCTIAVNNTYLQNQSIVERVCGLNGNIEIADADIWTIFGGVNDVLYNSPIGDIESTDTSTIYGALKAICANIRGRANNPKLFLFTPAQSSRDNAYMQNLVKAVKTVGKMYACPVIDVYNESGICHTNIANVLADGVHPNTIGSAMLVSTIASGIARNC